MGMLQNAQSTAPQDEAEPADEESQEASTPGAEEAEGPEPETPDQAAEGAESPDDGDQGPSKGSASQGAVPNPQDQQMYDQAVRTLYAIIYKDPKVTQNLIAMVQPRPHTVDSIAKASAILVQQVDKKINLDPIILPQLTMDAVDQLIDITERVKGVQISDGDAKAALGATFEIVAHMNGIDPNVAKQMLQAVSPQLQQRAQQMYSQTLQEGNAAGAAADPRSQGAVPPSPDQSAPPTPGGGPLAQGAQAAQGANNG